MNIFLDILTVIYCIIAIGLGIHLRLKGNRIKKEREENKQL